MVRRFAIAIIIIIGGMYGHPAHADDKYPRVQHYTLDVSFYPDESRMEGQAGVFFAAQDGPPQRAIFYLHGELHVDSIKSGSQHVKHSSEPVFYTSDYSLIATQCEMNLTGINPTVELMIYYSGYFHPSKARSPSDYMRIDDDGVFLRAYGYSLWFPTFLPARANEYTVTFAPVTIRTPEDYRSVFVGTKTDESVADGWRTTEWRASDVNVFAAQCTAQRYVVTSEGNYFMYHYDNPQSAAAAKEILDFAQRTNAMFEEYYRHGAEGGQFYVIEMPRYGDISSANVTGLMSSSWQAFIEEKFRQRHLAHELVHPYVGVPVDRSDSLWSFAIEGFPSFFHLPVLAESLGDEWYNRYMSYTEERYLKKRETGVDRRGRSLPPEKPLLAIGADEMSTYKDNFVLDDRALLFLNYLYSQMGHKTFYQFTEQMFNRDKLTADSFVQLVNQYLPGSAEDVDLWLNMTEYPERFEFANHKRESN